jgi:hypothetical protein
MIILKGIDWFLKLIATIFGAILYAIYKLSRYPISDKFWIGAATELFCIDFLILLYGTILYVQDDGNLSHTSIAVGISLGIFSITSIIYIKLKRTLITFSDNVQSFMEDGIQVIKKDTSS